MSNVRRHMNLRTTALLLAAIAVAIAIAAWMLRYQLVPVPAGGEGSVGFVYLLDRWTGEVKWIRSDRSSPVNDEP
jgi:hypothetical protein